MTQCVHFPRGSDIYVGTSHPCSSRMGVHVVRCCCGVPKNQSQRPSRMSEMYDD